MDKNVEVRVQIPIHDERLPLTFYRSPSVSSMVESASIAIPVTSVRSVGRPVDRVREMGDGMKMEVQSIRRTVHRSRHCGGGWGIVTYIL